MLEVQFYKQVADDKLKFAVIVAQSEGKWVFCRHEERATYECPGGHREKGESILDTARRELHEETGALDYSIKPICAYSVIGKNRVNETGKETFGMLYYADIKRFSRELCSEIEEVVLLDTLPVNWTYPEIQPKLLEKAVMEV